MTNGGELTVASMALAENLAAGVRELGLTLDAPRLRLLLEYLRLLAKWNRVYNLTAVRDPWLMVTTHLLDSLAVLPFVTGPRLLDVGSGAGLPGLVLAVAAPSLHCTLLDSNGKKTRFLNQAAIELRLPNVEVVQARVQDYRPAQGFDCIVSRAFAELAGFAAVAARLLNPRGRLLAMKGALDAAELGRLDAAFAVETHRLRVPGLGAERHLLVLAAPGGGAPA